MNRALLFCASLAVACTHASATTTTTTTPKTNAAPIFHLDGFERPESVLWDEARDRYLVSNIHGDAPGFVSIVSVDGVRTNARWIEGGKGGVTLNDPKGMGVARGVLYVADVTVVRTFDVETGAPRGDVAIEGATFLNDVAVRASDGAVFVSDCGVRRAESGEMVPTGSDAVFVIENGVARAFARGVDLGHPNGLAIASDGVWVVGTGEVYRLGDDGRRIDTMKLAGDSLDGIVLVGDRLLVSDWGTSAIYAANPGGSFTVLFGGIATPADIGLDAKRGRLHVPRIRENAIEAWAI